MATRGRHADRRGPTLPGQPDQPVHGRYQDHPDGLPAARADEADLAVIVVDSWQRRGVATALFNAMLPRAAAAGVRVVHADVAPANTAARAAVARLFGPAIRACFHEGLLHYRMRLA